jgi:hypothetical protein
MHFQIVMDTSGDPRHQFDPEDAIAAAEAKKRPSGLVRHARAGRGQGGRRRLRKSKPSLVDSRPHLDRSRTRRHHRARASAGSLGEGHQGWVGARS